MRSFAGTDRDPGMDAARARVDALFEQAARANLSVVVVTPPDETREAARDVATSAAIVAGRSKFLREATAAAREIVLTGFANAGFSGTWAVSEMSMSVATATGWRR
jgi:1-deoxy-D-xylulose 5-phosphate reductoisomerase